MAGNKRQRELARAKYERQQARRTKSAAARKHRQRIIGIVVVAALVIGIGAWAVLSRTSSSDQAAAPAPAATSAPAASTAPAESTTASPAASGQAASDQAAAEAAVLDCSAPGTVRADDKSYSAAPDVLSPLPASITLQTNCGPIVIALDAQAPTTVSSEAFLAKDGFYDATSCHRLTTSGIYVLQCGDPTATGSGGPGYAIADENLPTGSGVNYPAGTVAMANSGPNTNGSQFFIVYDDTTLPAGYSIWGQVTEGLDMVKEVASVGVADGSGDGTPRQPVFIESATVQQ